MTDFFATLGIFTGILLMIALGLYLLGRWHRWIDRRLRENYLRMSREDREQAMNAELGSIRHRNKFEGRHYDAA